MMASMGSTTILAHRRVCTAIGAPAVHRCMREQHARPSSSLSASLTSNSGHRVSLLRHKQQRLPARRSGLVVSARLGGRGSPDIADRVIASVPYLLPFLDAFSYGRFLFFQYPVIRSAIAPLSPLVALYGSVPFAPLVAFFGIYLGIVNNTSLSRFVRFNAMQAVLLDILLVLPRLLESVAGPPTSGWGLQAYMTSQNTIWVFIAASVLYGIGSSLLGQTARIPFVADAADQQVMR